MHEEKRAVFAPPARETTLTRRRFLQTTVAASIATATVPLFGTRVARAAGKPFAGVTLVVVSDFGLIKYLAKNPPALQKYQEKTGMTVKAVVIPYDDLLQKIMVDLSSGGGSYDVVLPDGAWAGQVMASGFVIPLNKFIEDLQADPEYDFQDIIESGFKFCQWKGEWFAMPHNYHGNGYQVYRKDLFEQEGIAVPKNWKEFEAVAKHFTKFKTKDGQMVPFGTAGAGARDDPICMEWMVRYRSAGRQDNELGQGALWDDQWRPLFNSPEGVYAAEFYRDMLKNYGPPAPSSMSWDEVYNLVQNGQVAIMGAYWDGRFGYLEDPSRSKMVGKMGYTHVSPKEEGIPRGGVFGTRPFYVNKASKNIPAALDFIKWATSKEVDLEFSLTERPNAMRKSVSQHPAYLEKFPMMKIRAASFAYMMPEPIIPEWAEAKEHIGKALSQIITGEKQGKEAMDQAAIEVEKMFKRAGYIKG
jgi:ABC-type glycerol-3-phosphate transport system substrate-binding protein